jgi:hypothetical protein
VKFKIEFSDEKNLILKETRSIDFDDVVDAINKGNTLDDIKHPNQKKYPNQKILVIKIKEYIYAVPYVIDKKRKAIFLKTIYPSRTLTKKYLKGESNE